MLEANCHCGAVRLRIRRRPSVVTECNCSICRRYGAQWAYYTRKSVSVECAPGAMAAYLWGDRTIEFLHCTTCGCVTHYESIRKTPDSRLALNARMLPAVALEGVRVRQFDGAVSWKYV